MARPKSATRTIKELIVPVSAKEKKKFITLFMIIIFSVLLVMSSYLENFYMKLWFQVIIFIAQLVIVNTILSDYYGID